MPWINKVGVFWGECLSPLGLVCILYGLMVGEMIHLVSDPSLDKCSISQPRNEPRPELEPSPTSLWLVRNHEDTEPESVLQVQLRSFRLSVLSFYGIINLTIWFLTRYV